MTREDVDSEDSLGSSLGNWQRKRGEDLVRIHGQEGTIEGPSLGTDGTKTKRQST